MSTQTGTPGWLTSTDGGRFEIAVRASSIIAIKPAPEGGSLVYTTIGQITFYGIEPDALLPMIVAEESR